MVCISETGRSAQYWNTTIVPWPDEWFGSISAVKGDWANVLYLVRKVIYLKHCAYALEWERFLSLRLVFIYNLPAGPPGSPHRELWLIWHCCYSSTIVRRLSGHTYILYALYGNTMRSDYRWVHVIIIYFIYKTSCTFIKYNNSSMIKTRH